MSEGPLKEFGASPQRTLVDVVEADEAVLLHHPTKSRVWTQVKVGTSHTEHLSLLQDPSSLKEIFCFFLGMAKEKRYLLAVDVLLTISSPKDLQDQPSPEQQSTSIRLLSDPVDMPDDGLRVDALLVADQNGPPGA